MRGQIIDINNLETFIELEDGRLISIPSYQTNKASIGNYIYISNNISNSPMNHSFGKYTNNIF
ncbi:hypothetical protein ACFO6R_04380 [Eubacterium multiforme]|uniref:Uncharacterized protein n=1 Tax=Eubacterium multiforme TaxID=83339 RepID=A0ABT9UV69_9FIRM|nr:hypothetical protein [Eubacterium multiforme]MDQ0150215.1 hypothetical protein [Eubacterium multiforme]